MPGVCSTLDDSRVARTPPMTVVTPSGTCSCVLALCVRIEGLPLTARANPGNPFSSAILMMTVLALVIFGVTVSFRAASRN